MDFFTSGIFWFIEGILFCVLLTSFKAWTVERKIRMSTWKWILVVIWILFAGFTVAFIGSSLGEGEKDAAGIGGAVFGVISLISAIVLWRVLGFTRKA